MYALRMQHAANHSVKRMALYHEVARLVRDEAFLIPIANTVYPWALRANVHGLTRQPLVALPVPEEPLTQRTARRHAVPVDRARPMEPSA